MSSFKRSRRHFATEQKVAILKRHMVDKVPVSDLCNELGLQPSVFYQWQRQAIENLAGAFSTPAAEGPSKREKELVAKTKELGGMRWWERRRDPLTGLFSGQTARVGSTLGSWRSAPSNRFLRPRSPSPKRDMRFATSLKGSSSPMSVGG